MGGRSYDGGVVGRLFAPDGLLLELLSDGHVATGKRYLEQDVYRLTLAHVPCAVAQS